MQRAAASGSPLPSLSASPRPTTSVRSISLFIRVTVYFYSLSSWYLFHFFFSSSILSLLICRVTGDAEESRQE